MSILWDFYSWLQAMRRNKQEVGLCKILTVLPKHLLQLYNLRQAYKSTN